MTHDFRRAGAAALALAILIALSSTGGAAGKKDKTAGKSAGPDSVVLLIGNRMFPDFGEIVSTPLHRRTAVGDTDYSFDVVKFYPHFTIMDSTKAIVSLSDEPKNPAFRIKVYKTDAVVDSTWAFYNMDVPHFSRSSALWFKVLAFDYRGKVFKKDLPKAPEDKNKKK
ncbi:MAG TPA: hypothetical protein VF128_13900 [Gemmatimonadaceae bacterium]